jgi:hypothetical protein
MSEITFLLRLAEVRCEIDENTASYGAPAGRFCGVNGREFGRELACSVESMGGSLGIRALLFGNFFFISFSNEK